MTHASGHIQPLYWRRDTLILLDQRVLPAREIHLTCRTPGDVATAIRSMAVRGAPLIGIAAAYGVVLSAQAHAHEPIANQHRAISADIQALAATRPTAVNLSWALQRMRRVLETAQQRLVEMLLREAQAIDQQHQEQNQRMAELGCALIAPGSRVMTHCNTGTLATGGCGTALGVIRSAFFGGRISAIFVTETRPWLQGARLTAWELSRDGIPATLITDSAAADRMDREHIQWLIVGADRIAANGDVANKIGTYGLAVAAHHHGVRCMVVAPCSSIDMALSSGADIPLEYRAGEELWQVEDFGPALPGIELSNPAFDVTPAALVDVLVTERGALESPGPERMRETFATRG